MGLEVGYTCKGVWYELVSQDTCCGFLLKNAPLTQISNHTDDIY